VSVSRYSSLYFSAKQTFQLGKNAVTLLCSYCIRIPVGCRYLSTYAVTLKTFMKNKGSSLGGHIEAPGQSQGMANTVQSS